MTPSEPARDIAAEAEEAFDHYLSLLEQGREVDFEAYCAEREPLADELRTLRRHWERLGPLMDSLGSDRPAAGPSLTLVAGSGEDGAPASAEDDDASPRRYAPRGEIARGGMGTVLRVWDESLRRNLAMKVMLPASGSGSHAQDRQRRRFLEEARITGQLDHPGIVPVHELGTDDGGRPYFTMRLVRGRSLREVFDLVAEGHEGWTVPRALGVVLKVCEAMAYAHSKHVTHRDLKPANIMVGRFGETYVMDWGLARVTGQPDAHADTDTSADETLTTIDAGTPPPDSPLRTRDGTVVGTPAYMAPEQARGDLSRLGAPSDIYSVGALIYHLLASRMPYGHEQGAQAVLEAVREGPPEPLMRVAPRAPAELVAICEKAMARRPAHRYRTMLDLSEDLRAFLEDRVVAAYEAGALAQLRKWVLRNRATATVLILAVAALTVLLAVLLVQNSMLQDTKAKLQSNVAVLDEREADLERTNLELSRSVLETEAARQSALDQLQERKATSYVAGLGQAEVVLRHLDGSSALDSLLACPEELRGWEWDHLALRADPSLASWPSHLGIVVDTAFSADGTLLATASWDGQMQVRHLPDGELLSAVTHGGAGVNALAFHPTARVVASADSGGTVRLFQAATGELLGLFTSPYEGGAEVTALAFDPDGRRLAAADESPRVWTWDLPDLDERQEPTPLRAPRPRAFPNQLGEVTGLAFSAGGRLLASTSDRGVLTLWSTQAGQALDALHEDDSALNALAFHPEEDWVVTASEGGVVRLIDPLAGRTLKVLAQFAVPVRDLDLDATGERVLCAMADGTLRGLSLTGTSRPVALNGHLAPLQSVAYHQGSGLVATGDFQGHVRLWDLTFGPASTRLAAHVGPVSDLAPLPGSDRVVSSARDGQILVWDPDTRVALGCGQVDGQGHAVLAITPDGTRFAAGMAYAERAGPHPIVLFPLPAVARLEDAADGGAAPVAPLRLAGHDEAVTDLAFTGEGRLLSGGLDGQVLLWDTHTGARVRAFTGSPDPVTAVAAHPERRWVAAGRDSGEVTVWHSGDGRSLRRLAGRRGDVVDMAFTPEGELLVGRSQIGRTWITRYRGEELAEVQSLELEGNLLDLAPHPHGRRLAASTDRGTVHLLQVPELTRLVTLSDSAATGPVCFSDDGSRLIVGSGRDLAVLQTEPAAASLARRQAQGAAAAAGQALLDALLDRFADPRLAIEHLRSLPADEPARDEALRLARAMGQDGRRLARHARDQLLSPLAGPALFDDVLRRARAAAALAPEDGWVHSILGLAHYRAGDSDSALSTLSAAQALHDRAGTEPPPAHRLVEAMASWQLGYDETARVFLEEALLSGSGDDPGVLALEREAQRLIRDT